jgi:N-acetylglucosaminyldiphosphoundecaprenol N-acetyl-beta-D-mannosaminyltransferase
MATTVERIAEFESSARFESDRNESERKSPSEVVRVFDLMISALTMDDALDRVDELCSAGEPSYVITANLNYAMVSSRDERLAAINKRAAFILADGMPLVWAARLAGTPLPGRTTGADLVPRICQRAAERGYRVFLLGGTFESTSAAARELARRNPELQIAGIDCPHLDTLTREQTRQLVARIRDARADILLAAFGQPKGELWIAEHYERFGPTVCLQIGASLDFIAGRVRRAPRWMQSTGLEWIYRVYAEPRRLWKRYAANCMYLLRSTCGALVGQPLRWWQRLLKQASDDGVPAPHLPTRQVTTSPTLKS